MPHRNPRAFGTLSRVMQGTCGPGRDARLNQVIKGTTTMVRKVIFSIALAGLLLGTAACNTVKGAGRDIESVGKAGDDAINH